MLLAARISAANKSQAQVQAPHGAQGGATVPVSTTLYVGKIAPQVRGAAGLGTIRAHAWGCCGGWLADALVLHRG